MMFIICVVNGVALSIPTAVVIVASACPDCATAMPVWFWNITRFLFVSQYVANSVVYLVKIK